MGLILRHFALLLASSAVLAVHSCKSESSRPMERDMTARMAERGAEEIGIGRCSAKSRNLRAYIWGLATL